MDGQSTGAVQRQGTIVGLERNTILKTSNSSYIYELRNYELRYELTTKLRSFAMIEFGPVELRQEVDPVTSLPRIFLRTRFLARLRSPNCDFLRRS